MDSNLYDLSKNAGVTRALLAQMWKWKMENGSSCMPISLSYQMRYILASLDSVASVADKIQKEA